MFKLLALFLWTCLFATISAQNRNDEKESFVEQGRSRAQFDTQVFDSSPGQCSCNSGFFVTNVQRREGNVVVGEYSYYDPLGTKIVVTYKSGPTNYVENRTVVKNFSTASKNNVVKSQQEIKRVVIAQIQSKLDNTVNKVIKEIDLSAVSEDGLQPEFYVEKIVSILRSRIVALIQNSLVFSKQQFDIEHLTEIVIREIRPTIRQLVVNYLRIRYRKLPSVIEDSFKKPTNILSIPDISLVDTTNTRFSITTDEVVRLLGQSAPNNGGINIGLLPTFVTEKTNKPQPLKVLPNNDLKLKSIIKNAIRQFTYEILKIQNIALVNEQSQVNSILSNIYAELGPEIFARIKTHTLDEDTSALIRFILRENKDKIIRIIRTVTSRSNVIQPDVSSPNTYTVRLISTLTKEFRPIVQFYANDFGFSQDVDVENIIKNDLLKAINEVYDANQASSSKQQVYDSVLQSLKITFKSTPVLTSEPVSVSRINLSNDISKLENSVKRVVRQQLSLISSGASMPEAELVQHVIEGLQNDIADLASRHLQRLPPSSTITKRRLITNIINELRPVVVREITHQVAAIHEQQNFQNENTIDSSAIVDKLAQRIIKELKPHIIRIIEEEFSLSKTIDSGIEISQAIYLKLEPFINAAVNKHATNLGYKESIKVYIINRLQKKLKESLTSVILAALKEYTEKSPSLFLTQNEFQLIRKDVEPFILFYVKSYLTLQPESNANNVFNYVIKSIRKAVILSIRVIKKNIASLDENSLEFNKIVNQIIEKLRPKILETIQNQLELLGAVESLKETRQEFPKTSLQTDVGILPQNTREIFGQSGTSQVSVETNDYKYNYSY